LLGDYRAPKSKFEGLLFLVPEDGTVCHGMISRMWAHTHMILIAKTKCGFPICDKYRNLFKKEPLYGK
jgi:hypothetical protein